MTDETTNPGPEGATPPPAAPAPESGTLLGGAPATPPATPEAPATAEGQTDQESDAKPLGASEKYEFQAPEGLTLSSAMMEKFEPLARELNLTNEGANKLLPLAAEMIQQHQQAQAEAWGKQINDWAVSVKSDKELGGQAFEASMHAAKAAFARFGTPELRALVDMPGPDNPNGLGLGNHPELVRVFARIGKAMAEDGFVKAEAPPGPNTTAKVLFPSMN